MRATPIRLIERQAVRDRATLIEREPKALMPAVQALVKAKTALDVRLILDSVPDVLHGAVAAYMAQRPARYPEYVVSEVARAAGKDKLKEIVGRRRAGSILTRYVRPVI